MLRTALRRWLANTRQTFGWKKTAYALLLLPAFVFTLDTAWVRTIQADYGPCLSYNVKTSEATPIASAHLSGIWHKEINWIRLERTTVLTGYLQVGDERITFDRLGLVSNDNGHSKSKYYIGVPLKVTPPKKEAYFILVSPDFKHFEVYDGLYSRSIVGPAKNVEELKTVESLFF